MKTTLLCLSLLFADITPEIDDKFESENKSSTQVAAETQPAKALPSTISSAEARQLQSIPAADTSKLIQSHGQEVTVQGKVHSVYIPKSGSPVILNLGENFKSCTKAIIDDQNFRKWKLPAKSIGDLYQNQEIVIEGQVGLFKELPQIELRTPTQIRIVQ